MGLRYRTVTKVGKGQYVTGNYSFGAYVFSKVLYWIFLFPFYAMIKYCIYLPTKWCIVKIIELINNKRKAQ